MVSEILTFKLRTMIRIIKAAAQCAVVIEVTHQSWSVFGWPGVHVVPFMRDPGKNPGLELA